VEKKSRKEKKMSSLKDLTEAGEKLCQILDDISKDEKKYSLELCVYVEQCNWEIEKNLSTIKLIKEIYG
jgi:hypothetical protein